MPYQLNKSLTHNHLSFSLLHVLASVHVWFVELDQSGFGFGCKQVQQRRFSPRQELTQARWDVARVSMVFCHINMRQCLLEWKSIREVAPARNGDRLSKVTFSKVLEGRILWKTEVDLNFSWSSSLNMEGVSCIGGGCAQSGYSYLDTLMWSMFQ